MRTEALRLAGEKVGADRSGDRVIRIDNPYTRECVGTVPKATLDDVRRAFDDRASATRRGCRASSAATS